MFKGSSDQLSYLNRTASHATKPHATGRIDDIPAWAKEPEEYYNSVRDQYHQINQQLIETQNKLAAVNEKLRHSMPHKEYEHIAQHKERLAQRATLLQEQSNTFRPIARAAGDRAWATMFFHIAQKMLPVEDFRILLDETKEFLGRKEVEIKGGRGMKSEQTRDNQRAQDTRRERRANWRKHQGGTVSVWRDNKPLVEKYDPDKGLK